MSFVENAQDMGLRAVDGFGFHHADEYSEVLYRGLMTTGEVPTEGNEDFKASSPIPNIALFTRKTSTNDWGFCGILSDKYKFEANSTFISSVREAINETETSIVTENVLQTPDLTQIRASMVLQNPHDIGEVGDVYPQVSIENSYNGSMSKRIAFGIHIMSSSRLNYEINFNFKKLGVMRQIHHQSHDTTVSSPIGNYVENFSSNITELFQSNFETQLTEDSVMAVLDNIEKIGSKPRRAVSSYISNEDGGIENVSAWDMFLAIARYTNFTTSLNTKRLLENAAERVLIVPTNMRDMLAASNS